MTAAQRAQALRWLRECAREDIVLTPADRRDMVRRLKLMTDAPGAASTDTGGAPAA